MAKHECHTRQTQSVGSILSDQVHRLLNEWFGITHWPRAWAVPSRTWLCAKICGLAKLLDQAPWALNQARSALCQTGLGHVHRQNRNTISRVESVCFQCFWSWRIFWNDFFQKIKIMMRWRCFTWHQHLDLNSDFCSNFGGWGRELLNQTENFSSYQEELIHSK